MGQRVDLQESVWLAGSSNKALRRLRTELQQSGIPAGIIRIGRAAKEPPPTDLPLNSLVLVLLRTVDMPLATYWRHYLTRLLAGGSRVWVAEPSSGAHRATDFATGMPVVPATTVERRLVEIALHPRHSS